jgi:hypothetical protein
MHDDPEDDLGVSPGFPGNQTWGYNKWVRPCHGEEANKVAFHPIMEARNDSYPVLKMLKVFFSNGTKVNATEVNVYFSFYPEGRPGSSVCLQQNAEKLPQNFSASIRNCSCTHARMYGTSEWADLEFYGCRDGMRLGTPDWQKWTEIYSGVKGIHSVRFLGVKGGYDDMYAIYTGVLAGLFGSAAALVPAFLTSIGLTVRHVYKARKEGVKVPGQTKPYETLQSSASSPEP